MRGPAAPALMLGAAAASIAATGAVTPGAAAARQPPAPAGLALAASDSRSGSRPAVLPVALLHRPARLALRIELRPAGAPGSAAAGTATGRADVAWAVACGSGTRLLVAHGAASAVRPGLLALRLPPGSAGAPLCSAAAAVRLRGGGALRAELRARAAAPRRTSETLDLCPVRLPERSSSMSHEQLLAWWQRQEDAARRRYERQGLPYRPRRYPGDRRAGRIHDAGALTKSAIVAGIDRPSSSLRVLSDLSSMAAVLNYVNSGGLPACPSPAPATATVGLRGSVDLVVRWSPGPHQTPELKHELAATCRAHFEFDGSGSVRFAESFAWSERSENIDHGVTVLVVDTQQQGSASGRLDGRARATTTTLYGAGGAGVRYSLAWTRPLDELPVEQRITSTQWSDGRPSTVVAEHHRRDTCWVIGVPAVDAIQEQERVVPAPAADRGVTPRERSDLQTRLTGAMSRTVETTEQRIEFRLSWDLTTVPAP